MQDNPLVYILILNWNSYKETIECVDACKQLDYQNVRLLVLDNDSKDTSERTLLADLQGVHFLQTGENLGYAAANNLGIRHALRHGADYVWLLNPDAVVNPSSLTTMVHALVDHPSIGICGPRVANGMEPSTFSFDGLRIDPDHGYAWQFNLADPAQKTDLVDVDCVSGCAMLLRMDMLSTIGLLREDFFLYYEDVELSLRANDHGWRSVVCATTTVHHDKHVPVTRYATGFRAERSRILLARLRGNCPPSNLFSPPTMNLVAGLLKQGALWKAATLLLAILLGILCGLVKNKKTIPTVDAMVKGSSHQPTQHPT